MNHQSDPQHSIHVVVGHGDGNDHHGERTTFY